MAKLTARTRDKLPDADFAGPDRSYPVPDKAHAANAKARATQAVDAGRMSKSTKARIDAKADKVIKKGKNPDKSMRNETHKHTEISTDRGKFAFRENISNKKPEKK